MRYQRPNNPRVDRALTPELHLVSAILRQALTDARSPRAEVRAEAVRFLEDPTALHYWEQWLGLDQDVLQRLVQNALRSGA